MVYYFEGRKVAVFLEGTLEGILDFKASTAMRAAYRLAFSLMVKVPATIATCVRKSGNRHVLPLSVLPM